MKGTEIFLLFFGIISLVMAVWEHVNCSYAREMEDVTNHACKIYRRLLLMAEDSVNKLSDQLKERTNEAIRYKGCYISYKGKYEALYRLHYGEDPQD